MDHFKNSVGGGGVGIASLSRMLHAVLWCGTILYRSMAFVCVDGSHCF